MEKRYNETQIIIYKNKGKATFFEGIDVLIVDHLLERLRGGKKNRLQVNKDIIQDIAFIDEVLKSKDFKAIFIAVSVILLVIYAIFVVKIKMG